MLKAQVHTPWLGENMTLYLLFTTSSLYPDDYVILLVVADWLRGHLPQLKYED